MVKKALREFASDLRAKKHRQTLLKLLGTFGGSKKKILGPDTSDLEPAEKSGEQHDYQAYIRELYASLVHRCLCLRDDGRKEITANLRLNGCCAQGEFADSVNFGLFFLDHPHHHGIDGSCQWQDTEVCVMRKKLVSICTVECFVDPDTYPDVPS